MEVQAGLLGRVTDTVFYQGATRRLIPISQPAPASASVEVLQAEIRQRLGNVAFYLEEREILRPGLAKYTGKTFCDPSNENAKRDETRIRNVETSLLTNWSTSLTPSGSGSTNRAELRNLLSWSDSARTALART